MAAQSPLEQKYAQLGPHLNERQRRLVAAADAQLLGRGGISQVSAASGLSRTTIHKGRRELQGDLIPDARVREAGGGRKRIQQQQPAVLQELEQLVAPATRGDPMSPLRWTGKSTSKLAAELRRKGYSISARTVARLLEKDLDYSLQANRKTKEGASHPDRNAQFEYIAEQTKALQQRGHPVISVDTKKRELVGEFKNGGREWQPKRSPEAVQTQLDDPGRVGHGQISHRHSGQRRRLGPSLYGKGGVSRRMELSHFTQGQMTNLFLRDALAKL